MKSPLVVLGIDVETDVGSWTPFYEGVEKGIPRLLGLFEKAGVGATFFFTGESARLFPVRAREVLGAGHEVGCHSLYHETVGDELFPIPGIRPLLPEEVPRRIELATALVEEACGSRPVSFRAPRLWGSTAMVNALEDLGYLADATYPLFFHRRMVHPYHPSRRDWLKAGRMRILEIPCFADIGRESADPHGRDLDQWPVFRTAGAEAALEMAGRFLGVAGAGRKTPVLCYYLHPWEFIEARARYRYGEGTVIPDPFIVRNCGKKALAELEKLIGGLRARFGARFTTCRELAHAYGKGG